MGDQIGTLSNRFICIGSGPGPKNVMFETHEGVRVVTAYALWKHKYKGEVVADAKAKYVTANGFVQFDPIEREANGKKLIDYTVKTPGGDGVLVRITVWEELLSELEAKGITIEKNDWLAADGKFSINSWDDKETGEKRSQPQISAKAISVSKGIVAGEREVVTASKSSF